MSSAAVKLARNDAAFLGVERSLTGRRWRAREGAPGLVEAFRRRFQLPEIAARLLAARGITLDAGAEFSRADAERRCSPIRRRSPTWTKRRA